MEEGVKALKNKIDYSTIANIMSFNSSYDKESDSLMIQSKEPVPAVSVDWDGDFWVRVNPNNGEIVGIEIEDYKGFFSKKYYSMLRGIPVTDSIIKAIIMTILEHGPRPYTKKDFTKDLQKACQQIVS